MYTGLAGEQVRHWYDLECGVKYLRSRAGRFSVAASFHFSSGGRSAIRSCRSSAAASSSWATLGLLSGPTLGWVNQRSGNTPFP